MIPNNATLLTDISETNNTCKIYIIFHSYGRLVSKYGRIGVRLRDGKADSTTEGKKLKKGYVPTKLVTIPEDMAPYNLINMFRYIRGQWVAYGYYNGYYKKLGLTMNNEQALSCINKYQDDFDSWYRKLTKV